MFALRKINNNYKDFAGSRSDFVVVGHPEFNLGRVYGDSYPPGWDTSAVKSLPRRSLPLDRMLRTGGHAEHLRRVADVRPRPPPKERALARARSEPQVAPRSSAAGSGAEGADFADFLAALTGPGELPACKPHRVTAGYGNHIKSQPVCKHYAGVESDLKDLKWRLSVDPDATKADLQSEESWKYYAVYLAQARRNEANLRKERDRSLPAVQRVMPPAG